jgi:hypothetical protein
MPDNSKAIEAVHNCDWDRVIGLTEKLKPTLQGYTGHEISQAFMLAMFAVGVNVGEGSAPIVVVKVNEDSVPKEEKKRGKAKKEYIN